LSEIRRQLDYDKSSLLRLKLEGLQRGTLVDRNNWGEEELRRFEVLLCIVDSVRYKRLDHLSVSSYLQMILTGLTPPLLLLRGGVEGRENLPKSLLVQLKNWAHTLI
jgi:hypothetical protein